MRNAKNKRTALLLAATLLLTAMVAGIAPAQAYAAAEKPAAPQGVAAAPGTGGQTTVAWSPVAGNLLGYFIYRSDAADGKYIIVGRTSAKADCNFVDKAAKADAVYYYKVSAVARNGFWITEGDKSEPVSNAMLRIAAQEAAAEEADVDMIFDIEIEALSSSALSLKWEPYDGADSYSVWRAQTEDMTDGEAYTELTTVMEPSYVDGDLEPNTSYYYAIYPMKDANNMNAMYVPVGTFTLGGSGQTQSPEPTETATTEPTPDTTATPLPTAEPTPDATATPLPTAEPTPDATATPLPTAEPTPDATLTPLPTAEPTPDATATPLPTAEPTPDATETPLPTAEPTPIITDEPTSTLPVVPTEAPTLQPTQPPTVDGSLAVRTYERGSRVGNIITWAAMPDSTLYTVYRSTDGQNYSSLGTTIGLSWDDPMLDSNTTYYYKVAGSNGAELLGSATTGTQKMWIKLYPYTAFNTSGVSVAWSHVAGAQQYTVYRSEDGANYTEVRTTSFLGYIDSELLPNTHYYYKVVADSGLECAGDITTPDQRLLPMAAPMGFGSNGCIRLAWNNIAHANTYTIYRSTYPGGGFVPVGTTADRFWVDGSVDSWAMYYYKIEADTGHYGRAASIAF